MTINKRYILICELAFGCIPIDYNWAINTVIYKRIESNLNKKQ